MESFAPFNLSASISAIPDKLEVDLSKVRDISPDILGDDGRMQVLPAAFWAETTVEERALFGHKNGIYSFPTVELVERLKKIIDGRSAIEIGAGHGVLADALGIPGTDNRQQEMPQYAAAYALAGQPRVKYGPNIVELHASKAVRHFKPEVVIGCWVTHKWSKHEPWREGNEIGVDEVDVMRQCKTYVLVGNEHTHRHSRIWAYNPAIEYPDWLYSRASNGKRDLIAVRDRRR